MYEREGFSRLQKNQMMLTPETLLGLRITGIYSIFIYAYPLVIGMHV